MSLSDPADVPGQTPSPPSATEPAASAVERRAFTELSKSTLWIAGAALGVLAAGLGVFLFLLTRGDTERVRNQLEAIKAAGTIVVGAGGLGALLLAARRQQAAEFALNQKRDELQQKDEDLAAAKRVYELQKRAAEATEADALARRIAEEFTRATDQLGSEKAPVRLAGLYALERLAQSNPGQRQTVVNVLCAYLRMPYTPPTPDGETRRLGVRRPLQGSHRPATRIPRTAPVIDVPPGMRMAERLQEQEVRLTAQRILTDHLRMSITNDPYNQTPDTSWTNISIDLTAATLIDFQFDHCRVRVCLVFGVSGVVDQ